MRADEIREGDIVEIDYITEFTKEHINEGKALVIWKGFNNQPLVRKLDTKRKVWDCYENIAKVVGHIDIDGYIDKALNKELCDDCISRKAVIEITAETGALETQTRVKLLPSVTPQPKIGHWIKQEDGTYKCSNCKKYELWEGIYCASCGAKMIEPQESEEKG